MNPSGLRFPGQVVAAACLGILLGPAAESRTSDETAPDPGRVAAPPAGSPWEWLQTYEYPTVTRALERFEADLADDPEAAIPMAGVAAALAIRIGMTWDTGEETARRAERLSLRVLELEPDRVESQFARALVEILRLDYQGAERRSRQALSLPGNPGLAPLALGEALSRRGKWEEAERVYREALRDRGPSCPIAAGLAAALREQERYKEALETARQAIDAFPECFLARFAWTSTVHLARRTGTALRGQSRLAERYPESGRLILLNAGAMFLKAGRYPTALELYRRVELGPGTPYLKVFRDYGISLCLDKLGFQGEAEESYRRLIEEFPPTRGGSYLKKRVLFPAYLSLDRLLWSSGRTGEALSLLEGAAADPEAPAHIIRRLGDRYLGLGLIERAEAAFERAVDSGRFEDLYDQGRTMVRWVRTLVEGNGGDPPPDDQLSPLMDFERDVPADGDLGTLNALARAFALAGRPRKSLYWLERSVRAGYRDADSLRRDPDFSVLQDRRKFRRILERIESPRPAF